MRKSGFTLIELVIANALGFALVLVILSLQASVLNAQLRQMRVRKISGDAINLAKYMQKDFETANILIEPQAGEIKDRMLGYKNVSPLDFGPIVPSEPQSYFLYCYNPESETLYRYAGSYPMSLVLDPFYCGHEAVNEQTLDVVMSGSDSILINCSFMRSPYNPDSVILNYSAGQPPDDFTGSLAFSLKRSI